jgi:hypothetical protein
VSGNGYFVNTTSGAVTITLPASPSAGDIVGIADYAKTFDTNNVTVARNGSNIAGEAKDGLLSTEGTSVTIIYVDGTKGWITVNQGNQSDLPLPSYITATGGTITEDGDYKIHTFTGPGTFTVCSVGNCAAGPLGSTVDYLVIAGGGGSGYFYGGGGGAGGYREGYNPGSYTASPLATSALPVSASPYPITVGGGGSGAAASLPAGAAGTNGSPSTFSSITSAGGGFGGGGGNPGFGPVSYYANPGGSGGGEGFNAAPRPGGTGNTPPVSPPQGNNGGPVPPGSPPTDNSGGGGATAVGDGGGGNGKQGGAGAGTGINPSCTVGTSGPDGSLRYFAGGGSSQGAPTTAPIGGGGYPQPPGTATIPGVANTGGGAGAEAASGGSGIVIIRYKFQ